MFQMWNGFIPFALINKLFFSIREKALYTSSLCDSLTICNEYLKEAFKGEEYLEINVKHEVI